MFLHGSHKKGRPRGGFFGMLFCGNHFLLLIVKIKYIINTTRNYN